MARVRDLLDLLTRRRRSLWDLSERRRDVVGDAQEIPGRRLALAPSVSTASSWWPTPVPLRSSAAGQLQMPGSIVRQSRAGNLAVHTDSGLQGRSRRIRSCSPRRYQQGSRNWKGPGSNATGGLRQMLAISRGRRTTPAQIRVASQRKARIFMLNRLKAGAVAVRIRDRSNQ